MSRYVVTATWDDVPHLSTKDKESLLKSCPPHQRDARSKGVPSMGAGAVYPVSEDDIKEDPFEIPDFWPRAYALDVGWNVTGTLWMAIDPESGTCHIYNEHYRSHAEPEVHAASIKQRGDWINGCVDPAARGRSQIDGRKIVEQYMQLGLRLVFAENAVESGLYETWSLLSAGRLKVWRTCTKFFEEYRLYRRRENGVIVKQNDHLMDCMRYLVMTGRSIANIKKPKATAYVPTVEYHY